MDWLLDVQRDDATAAAVKSLEDHLLRHTSDESLVSAAVERATAAIGQLSDASDGELLWMHLDWSGVLARLDLHPVRRGSAPEPADGFEPMSALQRDPLSRALAGQALSLDLTVPREVVMNFDPDVVGMVALDPLSDGPAAATVALAAATEAHPVAAPDQVAAAAGAMLADAALGDGHTVGDFHDVVSAFARVHGALGGASHAVVVDDDHIELLVDRSPFGAAITQIPSLARVTEAIAGRIAARVEGKATVVHDESLGLGDPSDRIQILFGEVDGTVCGSTYSWPPAGTHEKSEPSPRLEMTVSLPRQSHSVPVIRRLAAQILKAFGVESESIHDVELAISEACANVIQHAVDSDGYEVTIELGADRCALTVLDRGEGFDASRVDEQDDVDAESGRGLSLMRALVDNLNFVSEPMVGAVVHMVKRLDYDAGHPFRRTGTG